MPIFIGHQHAKGPACNEQKTPKNRFKSGEEVPNCLKEGAMSKPLLQTGSQLEMMLDHFYARVREDALIGPIFNDIAKVDWEEHIPKI